MAESISKSRHKFLILLLVVLSRSCRSGASISATHRHYYTSVSRLGLVRGLTWTALDDEPAQVVAFLGLPYAAPPIGPLRFMPPGAVSQNQLPQSRLELHQLMPGNQRAQVRDQSRFGNECVHLPDWLPGDGEHSNGGGPKDGNKSRRDEGAAGRRARQSEDCLNLNAFVPIPIQHAQLPQAGPSSSAANSMRQQINSNYPPPPPPLSSSGGNKPEEQDSKNHSSQRSGSYPPSLLPVNQDSATDKPSELKLWPLPKLLAGGGQQAQGQSRLPLLVLFHAQQPSAANSLGYLQVAHRTNSILVTFNCRAGLLGFLPLSDEGARRHNHAIWDQIGLLHWLKHNAGQALGADAQNVTLLAADNQATQWIRLLAMSPHAKGLFNRVVLVHDERQQVPNLALDFADVKATQSDARRRLALALSQVVAKQQKSSAQMEEQQAFEIIERADLAQLAQIDEQLRRTAQSSQLALAVEPTLDDRLLFPHLAAMAANRDSPLDRLRAQLDYCTYLRQLYSGQPDTLNLIGFESSPTNVRNLAGSWRREAMNGSSAEAQSVNSDKPTKAHKQALAADKFYHLRHVHELAQVLDPESDNSLEHSPAKVNLSPRQKRESLASARSQQHMNGDHDQLLGLLASYDLMIGYFGKGDIASDSFISSSDYPGISTALSRITTSGFNRHLLSLLRLADLHFVAALSSNNERYCDLFALNQKPSKTNHVFLASAVDAPAGQATVINWLSDIAHNQPRLLASVVEFVRSGVPNQEWPSYDSLNRQIINVDSEADSDRVSDRILSNLGRKVKIRLDLEPYLSDIAQARTTRSEDDLVTCFDDIEQALNKSLKAIPLREQLGCLSGVAARYRNQLHQLAADDLEPLIRAASRQSQADSPQVASSITTRNLVNEPGQQTNLQQQQHQQQSQERDDQSSVATTNSWPQQTKQLSSPNSFAQLLRQVLSKPLAVIIFAGLLIFIINLIIVIAISFRSAQNRRRVRSQELAPQDPAGDNQLNVQNNLLLNKKSTLKRPTDNRELHSAIRNGNSCNSLARANKQLTFSLPGNATLRESLAEQPMASKNLAFGCPVHSSAPNSNSRNNNHHQLKGSLSFGSPRNEEQNLPTCNHHHLTFLENTSGADLLVSEQSSELVLDATPILESQYDRGAEHAQVIFQSEWPICQAADGGNQPSNSPLGYLSHSTNTTTTTSGTFRRANGSLESPQAGDKSNLQLGVHLGSQQSPESSTTLSVTPLQLESFVAPYNYQIEPVNVIYHGQNLAFDEQQQLQMISQNKQTNQQCFVHAHRHCIALNHQQQQERDNIIMSDTNKYS